MRLPVTSLFAVALGSGFGGVLRYAIGFLLAPLDSQGATLTLVTVNAVGSLAIGLGVSMLSAGGRWPSSAEGRLFLLAGVCGGFTTFSFFSLQSALLLQSGAFAAAAGFAFLTLVLSLAGVVSGYWLGRLSCRGVNGPLP